MNSEIIEILKNIRILKSQTEILQGINLTADEAEVLTLAYAKIIRIMQKYLDLKGDYD